MLTAGLDSGAVRVLEDALREREEVSDAHGDQLERATYVELVVAAVSADRADLCARGARKGKSACNARRHSSDAETHVGDAGRAELLAERLGRGELGGRVLCTGSRR